MRASVERFCRWNRLSVGSLYHTNSLILSRGNLNCQPAIAIPQTVDVSGSFVKLLFFMWTIVQIFRLRENSLNSYQYMMALRWSCRLTEDCFTSCKLDFQGTAVLADATTSLLICVGSELNDSLALRVHLRTWLANEMQPSSQQINKYEAFYKPSVPQKNRLTVLMLLFCRPLCVLKKRQLLKRTKSLRPPTLHSVEYL